MIFISVTMSYARGVLFAICLCAAQGQRVPFNSLDEAEYITEINTFRRQTGSQNMECITNWDQTLAEAAASAAARCNTSLPADSLGYAFASSGTVISANTAILEMWSEYTNAYAYATGTCDATLTNLNTCSNGLQMLWYEGGPVGCAQHQCNTTMPPSVITACAFNNRMVTTSRPFVLVPGLPPCTVCSSQFPTCRQMLCCTSGDSVVQPPLPPGTSVPTNLITLTRLYYDAKFENVLTTNQATINNYVSLGAALLGPVGQIASGNNTACASLTPVIRYNSPNGRTNFYTNDPTRAQALVGQGYTRLEEVGWAVSARGSCNATKGVAAFLHPSYGYVQLTDQNDIDDLFANRKWPNYKFQGYSFYIW